jgi:cell division protein FtsZ
MMNEMTQIQSFMNQFQSGIEVIWGIYFDDALGQQLKVTLLDTGFAIENVPQIKKRNDKLTDEELKRREEKQNKIDKWREAYYPENQNNLRVRKYIPYILSADQMDNEALFDLMEQMPANKRDRKFSEKIMA